MKRHVSARDGPRAIHKLIAAGMQAVSARNSARHSDWLGIYDSGCRTYSSHADSDEHHQSIWSSMSPTQRLSRLTSTNLVGHRNLDPRPSRQRILMPASSVSSGEAEGRWYAVATDSFHPTQASLASFIVLTAKNRRSFGTQVCYLSQFTSAVLDCHAPAHFCPADKPAQLHQTSSRNRRQPSNSPAFCGLSQQPTSKPYSGTAVESRSVLVSVLALCMFPAGLNALISRRPILSRLC
jgi:hypothetical protein